MSNTLTQAPTITTIGVRKRDGKTIQSYNHEKIAKALKSAFKDIEQDINGDLENMLAAIDNETIVAATDGVIDVESIQDIVKRKLMDYQYHKAAEAYIIYANKRTELRKKRLKPNQQAIKDFIHITKYAKWIENEKRREGYLETVSRSERMHIERYPIITDDLKWAFDKVREYKALGSMRSMQYGGEAQLAHHARGYNCSFSVCNRIKFFSEAFYLLLAGTGVGFSVQWQHIEKLPELRWIDRKKVKHFTIPDTIEGWADAIHELLMGYVNGVWVEFNYSKIRGRGSRLRTSGGRAPGHLVLRDSLEMVRKVLERVQGRQLEPIECHDIVCMIAEAVYAGGVREAALISLFSQDDGHMMRAKTGDWRSTHPWRERANNSVILQRGQINKEQFKRIFRSTKEWGEPGFFFVDDLDSGTNPCGEIALNPKLTITPELKMELEGWAKANNKKLPKLVVNDIHWGWQFCNLSSINCAACETTEEFMEAVKAASIIGTVQAGYTTFPYMGWITEAICRREALLGVSMTGMMDKPEIALDPEIQRTAAQLVVETNIEIARKIGINSAARSTCVKPHGNSGLALGAIGSGIHYHHARRYFRNMRVNVDDPAYQYFRSKNPHMCTALNDKKHVITFPVQSPDSALIRKDFTAIQFLDKVLSTQLNWVMPGTAKPNSSPGLCHNVSNTVTVKPNEWDLVYEYLWDNRKGFSGITLLGDAGDKKYDMAPMVEVTDAADEARWQHLIGNYNQVDWSKFTEDEDNTELKSEPACAGGACQYG